MRRTIPFVVAVVATTVVVLGVMVGVGIGAEPGGSPSEVFTQTDPGICSDDEMAQVVDLGGTSGDLLVYFTGEWTGLGKYERGYLWFRLDDTDTDFDWQYAGDSLSETTGTVMWTFENVAAGTHTVSVHSEVMVVNATPGGTRGQASADLQACAFTVFVIRAA